MLARLRRRWANIELTLGQRIMLQLYPARTDILTSSQGYPWRHMTGGILILLSIYANIIKVNNVTEFAECATECAERAR